MQRPCDDVTIENGANHRMKSGMGWAVALGVGTTLASFVAIANDSASLPFVPYASSYLQMNAGKLFKPGSTPVDPAVRTFLAARIFQNAAGSSTSERFDLLRRSVLGQADPLTPSLKNTHFQPDAKSWEGQCVQWSAAALDPAIERLLDSTSGIVCGDVMISFGEIKELFTALYSNIQATLFCGSKTLQRRGSFYGNPVIRGARDRYGFDDFAASDFDSRLYEYLKAGKGVILDVDPGPQVWNQPVYAAKSVDTTISFPSGFRSSGLLERAPAYVFEGTSPVALQALAQLRDLDLALDSRLLRPTEVQVQVLQRRPGDPATRLAPTEETLRADFDQVKALSDQRDLLARTRLNALVDVGEIRLKPGMDVSYRSTTVSYSSETGYADPRRNNSAQQKYDYFLFKKDGVTVDSVWDTPSQGNWNQPRRPDSMWVPMALTPAAADTPSLRGVYDLFKLVQSNNCVDISQVMNFYQHLDRALSDNFVTPTEKQELKAEWPKVKDVANRDKVRQMIRDSGAPGIQEGDFP